MPKFLPLILAALAPLSGLKANPPAAHQLPPSAPAPIPQLMLEKLQDDGILDVRIVVGFLDASDRSISSRSVSWDIWKKLQDLGFENAPVPNPRDYGIESDQKLPVEELIVVQAPAWSGEGIIRVAIMTSSKFQTLDEIDQDPAKAEAQLMQSIHARQFLKAAIKEADVWNYTGHSREEGGPNTFKPVLTPDGRVDFKYYNEAKQGVADIDESIRERGGIPSVMSFVSCLSGPHFEKYMYKWARKFGQPFYFAGTQELIYFSENPAATVALISSLRATQPAKVVESSLNDATRINPATKKPREDPFFRFKPIPGR